MPLLLPNNALCVQISFSSKPLRAVNDYPPPYQEATLHGGIAALCSRYDFNELAASVKVHAIKL
jgi:hypothetical protein